MSRLHRPSLGAQCQSGLDNITALPGSSGVPTSTALGLPSRIYLALATLCDAQHEYAYKRIVLPAAPESEVLALAFLAAIAAHAVSCHPTTPMAVVRRRVIPNTQFARAAPSPACYLHILVERNGMVEETIRLQKMFGVDVLFRSQHNPPTPKERKGQLPRTHPGQQEAPAQRIAPQETAARGRALLPDRPHLAAPSPSASCTPTSGAPTAEPAWDVSRALAKQRLGVRQLHMPRRLVSEPDPCLGRLVRPVLGKSHSTASPEEPPGRATPVVAKAHRCPVPC